MLQQPLNSRDGFRPGTGFNVNAGVRYVGLEHVTPSLQVNARIEGRESGANADVDNSGATLVYLSPGVNFQVADAAARLRVRPGADLPARERPADRAALHGDRRASITRCERATTAARAHVAALAARAAAA